MSKIIKLFFIAITLFTFTTGCGNSNEDSKKYSDSINGIRNAKFEILGEDYNIGQYIDYALTDAKWSEDDKYVGDRGNGAIKVVGKDKKTGNDVEIVWIKNIENASKRESKIDYIVLNGSKEDDDAMAFSNYIQYLETYKSDLESQKK